MPCHDRRVEAQPVPDPSPIHPARFVSRECEARNRYSREIDESYEALSTEELRA